MTREPKPKPTDLSKFKKYLEKRRIPYSQEFDAQSDTFRIFTCDPGARFEFDGHGEAKGKKQV